MRGVIFDLDGVLVSTDELHYHAWKSIADGLGIAFDESHNHALRGVSRMESLERLLGDRAGEFTDEQKHALAADKNDRYRASLKSLTPRDRLAGVDRLLEELRAHGVRMAVASASKNAREILDRIGLSAAFDAVVDGVDAPKSKPDPQAFVLAAERLGLEPPACVVVEDADAGVRAARAAGMRVIAVGAAAGHPEADDSCTSLGELTSSRLLG